MMQTFSYHHPTALPALFNLLQDALQWVPNLNILGTIYPNQVFGKVVPEQGFGCVLNISSMADLMPTPECKKNKNLSDK